MRDISSALRCHCDSATPREHHLPPQLGVQIKNLIVIWKHQGVSPKGRGQVFLSAGADPVQGKGLPRPVGTRGACLGPGECL